MEMETKIHDAVLIIRPRTKRIDSAVSAEFAEDVLRHFTHGMHAMVLDIANIDFIDSRGIGTLIALFKKIDEHGTFTLCNVSPSVMSLFRVTRMDMIFTIYADEEQALQNLLPAKKG